MHCGICCVFQDSINDPWTGDGDMHYITWIDLEGKKWKDWVCEICFENNVCFNKELGFYEEIKKVKK